MIRGFRMILQVYVLRLILVLFCYFSRTESIKLEYPCTAYWYIVGYEVRQRLRDAVTNVELEPSLSDISN